MEFNSFQSEFWYNFFFHFSGTMGVVRYESELCCDFTLRLQVCIRLRSYATTMKLGHEENCLDS